MRWGKFAVGELFSVSLPSGDIQADKSECGNVPLLSAGFTNNGICKLIWQGDGKSELYSGNVISVDMFGKAFFHGYNFYSVSHGRINILTPQISLNEYHLKFIITSINFSVKGKFSYNQMCSSKRAKNLVVMLPVNDSGNPDWAFMEGYMRERERAMIERYISHVMGKDFGRGNAES